MTDTATPKREGTIFLKHIASASHGIALITAVIPGEEPLLAKSDHPNFGAIKLLESKHTDSKVYDLDWVQTLFDASKVVEYKLKPLSDRVSVQFNQVYFDGDPVDNSITEFIVKGLNEGNEHWKPYVRFLERLMTNPTEHSRQQLYTWMTRHLSTITTDGLIVGYKSVKTRKEGGFQSINGGTAWVNGEEKTGAIQQNIGDVVTMPRSKVNHNPSLGCSVGLHVANWRYASTWSQQTDVILEVHVDPRDVVSVPSESNEEKVRVCRYKIIGVVREPHKTVIRETTEKPSIQVVEHTFNEVIDKDEAIPTQIPQDVWDKLVSKAKKAKRGLQPFLVAQGYELTKGANPKLRESWINS